jgi:hypothetical protein
MVGQNAPMAPSEIVIPSPERAESSRKATNGDARRKPCNGPRRQIGKVSSGDYSLANCADEEWKMPAPETWEAIRKAATTAGTLISLRN